MKSNKILVFALAALALSGCNFFDNNSPSALDAKDVFSDPVRTEQAVFAVYDQMGGNNGYRNRIGCGFAGLNTDVEWSTQSTSSTAGSKALVTYNCGITNDRISNVNGSDIWTYLNTSIERCNNIIEGIDQYGKPDENPELSYLLGEALYLRAFCYLEMVKYWGDVQPRFESLGKNPEGVKTPKGDRNIIFDQIRADLVRAADRMPWSENIKLASANNNIGRANKAAALALLARAALMQAGKAVRPGADGHDLKATKDYKVVYNLSNPAERIVLYEQAMDACAQIINHESEDKLAADFETPFRNLCMGKMTYKQSEHIWVMPFAYGSRGQILNYNAPKLSSNAATAVVGHLPGFGSGGSSNGNICVSPYLLAQFEPGDTRLAVTVVPGQWEFDNGNGESSNAEVREKIFPGKGADEKKLYQKHASISNFYCGKYRFEWYGEAGMTLTSTDDGVAFPVIRFADVLLMFAEAELGDNDGAKPVNKTGLNGLVQLNRVRNRAHVTPLQSYGLADIQKERALEFCGEYIRKYDLMRWGILRERMVEAQKYIREIAADGSRHAKQMGDTLFYKYVKSDKFDGFEIDVKTMYGLRPGEQNRQPGMTVDNGWQAKDIYNSDSKGYILSEANYPIFENDVQLETRQYWPIFQHNLTAAGPDVLWNNYGYE